MELTEYSSRKDLLEALKKVANYSSQSIENDKKLRRCIRMGKALCSKRVRTPEKLSALYLVYCDKKIKSIGRFVQSTLLIPGKEGMSMVFEFGNFLAVIHGHAIKRYMERSTFSGTFEQCQEKLIVDLGNYSYSEKDRTDEDTYYVYFDGGIFLCKVIDEVFHLRTFIMNRQCYPVQRMMSLSSENFRDGLRRESVGSVNDKIFNYYYNTNKNKHEA